MIVDVPTVRAVASPDEAMEATLVDEDAQVTVDSDWVELSVNFPVAVNCCVVPFGMEAELGEIAIETNAGAVTVRLVVALMAPEEAVITDEPCVTVLARPAAEMVATPVLAELQKQEFVTSLVVLSLKVPSAVNCCISPSDFEGLDGEMTMETRLTVGVFVDPPPQAVMQAIRTERQTKGKTGLRRALRTDPGIFSHLLCCNRKEPLNCTTGHPQRLSRFSRAAGKTNLESQLRWIEEERFCPDASLAPTLSY